MKQPSKPHSNSPSHTHFLPPPLHDITILLNFNGTIFNQVKAINKLRSFKKASVPRVTCASRLQKKIVETRIRIGYTKLIYSPIYLRLSCMPSYQPASLLITYLAISATNNVRQAVHVPNNIVLALYE